MSTFLRQKVQGFLCHLSTLKTTASNYLNLGHSKSKFKKQGISKPTRIHSSKLYKSFFLNPEEIHKASICKYITVHSNSWKE